MGECYGRGNSAGAFSRALNYATSQRNWSATGSLNDARAEHTATLMPDGKVLVAGGSGHSGLLPARNCTSASGTWTFTGSLNTRRSQQSARCWPMAKFWWLPGPLPGSVTVASLPARNVQSNYAGGTPTPTPTATPAATSTPAPRPSPDPDAYPDTNSNCDS